MQSEQETSTLQSTAMKPIPDNIKEIIAKLDGAEQAAMKGYIGTLRAEIKELKEEAIAKSDPDPLAHYHGDQKCTEDHSHGHDHKKEGHHEHKEHKHKHKEHDSHEHKHDSHEHKHDSHEHKHEHSNHSKSHEHSHGHKGEGCEKEACTENHDHEHEHKHKHEHEHKKPAEKTKTKEEEIPAWKKKALESGDDPNAAPFGGTWNEESSISAKPDVTMEESAKADDTAATAESKMEE